MIFENKDLFTKIDINGQADLEQGQKFIGKRWFLSTANTQVTCRAT